MGYASLVIRLNPNVTEERHGCVDCAVSLRVGDEAHFGSNFRIPFPQGKKCVNHLRRPLLLDLAVRNRLKPIAAKKLDFQSRTRKQSSKFFSIKYSSFTLSLIAIAEGIDGGQ